jgi:glycosyltransferase 2 family protein
MKTGARKSIVIIAAVVVVALLVFRSRHSITLSGFHWTALAAWVRQAHSWYLLLALLGIYACYFVRAVRWRVFSKYMGSPSLWSVYEATLEGFSCVFLLGRLGEPVRPLLIARKEKLPVSGMFGVYTLERLLDITATAVAAGVALALFHGMGPAAEKAGPLLEAAHRAGIVLLAGSVLALVVLVYLRLAGGEQIQSTLERGAAAGSLRMKVADIFEGFHDGLQAIRTGSDAVMAAGLTFLHWGGVLFVYVACLKGFGGTFGEMGFLDALLVMTMTMVGSAVQLPGVGGGSQVATFLVFEAIFGIEKEPAAAAAIVIWLITFASVSLAGVPLLIREGWSVRELKNLARSERAAEAAGTHVEGDAGGALDSERSGKLETEARR